jgi:hypothetical protein
LNPAADIDSHLTRRSGNREAVIYDAIYCSGDVLDTETNFGCGGTCHQVSGGASILLKQDSKKGAQPTASLFSDSYCKNKIASAGIYSGQYSGCTNVNDNDVFNSVYLYYDC